MAGTPAIDTALAKTTDAPAQGAAGAERAEPAARLGSALGPFVLNERVGAGGMGVVFAAHDPILDRKVAIKVLRPDLFGASHTRRMRLLREAQALARLSHPNVVTVYQAGVADDQVFIAMEFVPGQTLREWLAVPRTPAEIVAAFVAAGRGLAAAHRAGLVHRDFKPDNVLVGDDGRVRVTDFGLVGVAAASSSDDVPATPEPSSSSSLSEPLTHAGMLLGTPRYMALEQHRGLPVDARADQFAFAVALFEALYRVAPFPGRTPGELLKSLEAGPVVPADTAQVPRWLRPIVLRALCPRSDERFRSMDEMLAALETGPSRTWRWVAAGIGVAGVAAAGFLALRPPTCRDARELLAGVWDAPVRARVDSAFAAAAGGPRGKEAFDHSAALLDRYAATWASMRDESCRASSRGEQSAAMQDLRTSCLDARLGHLRALAGLFADADAQTVNRAAGAAMSLDRLEPCSDPAALAGTPALPADAAKRAAILAARNRAAQALTLYNAGRIAAAKTEATAAVADARGIGYGPVLAEALRTLGQVIIDTDLKAAQAALEEAIAVGSEAKADRVVAQAHMGLMWVVGVKQARRQEALAMQPLADAAIRRAGGGDAMRSVLLHDVGRILLNDGKFAEAEATLRESAALAEKVYGKDSNNLGRSLRQLAAVLEREEKFDEARVCAERAVDIFERAFGSNSPEYAAGVSDLGTLAWYVRDLDTAVQHTKHAIAIFEVANAGQPTSDLAGQYHNLGQMTEEQGKHAEARTYFDKALAMSEKLLGPDHPRVAQTLYSIAEVDVEEGDRKHAIETMRRALAIQDKRLPPDHPDIAYVLSGLAEVLGKEGQYDEAAQLAARALAIREKKLGPTHTEVGKALVVAAAIEIDRDRWKDALPLLERAVPILQSDAGAVARANAEFGLAEAYVKLGRDRARAIAMARDARTILEKSANTGKTLAEIDAWLAKNR